MEERGAGISGRRWAGKVGGGGGLGAGIKEEERAARVVVMVAREEGTSRAGEQLGGGASRHARCAGGSGTEQILQWIRLGRRREASLAWPRGGR
jgi:hypothetical protein